MLSLIKNILRPVKTLFIRDHRPKSFLSGIKGLIHVGANTGQERDEYKRYGLKVIWIEPIPEVFAQLEANLAGYKNQRAIRALLTNDDGKEYQFKIANNNGASSSILDFKHHKDVWPEIDYCRTVSLVSTTLPLLLQKHHVNLSDYRAIVLDTQGSELLILRGSISILSNFEFIKLEVADFESYEGCCQLPDVTEFMTQHGYKEVSRHNFAKRSHGGSYFDVLYQKKSCASLD